MSLRKIDKRGEGGEEGLTLFGLMLTLTAIFLIVFSMIKWDKSKKDYEEKSQMNIQDPQRFMSSFLSIKVKGGTLYDLLLDSHLRKDYSQLAVIDVLKDRYYSEDGCIDIFVNGVIIYQSNTILSCKPKMEAEMPMPAYGKDIVVGLIAG